MRKIVFPLAISGLCTFPLGMPLLAEVIYAGPDGPGWSTYEPNGTYAQLTGPTRNGHSTLELRSQNGSSSNWIYEVDGSTPPLATWGDFVSLSFNYFVESFSSPSGVGYPLPPQVALRVYHFGDPRTFFVYLPNFVQVPTGQWLTRSATAPFLGTEAVPPNAPPYATPGEIPLDAPIVEIHVRSPYPWDGESKSYVDGLRVVFRDPGSPVPEQSTFALLGVAVIGVLWRRRSQS